MQTPLQNLLNLALDAYPARTAIRCGDRAITYADLNYLVGKAAAGFARLGVNPGDRVAWFLPNSLEAVVTTLACYRIGAVSVPVNYRYVAPEVQYVLEWTTPRLLVFHQDRAEVVRSMGDAVERLSHVVVGSTQAVQSFWPWETIMADTVLTRGAALEDTAPALILFTSGSTGHPKGVTHSHWSAWSAIDNSRQALDIGADDVVLVGKPISHAGGLQTQLLPALSAGSQIILSMKPTPELASDLIRRHSVSQYGMLASDLLDFVEYLEESGVRLPSLRNSIGSGDSVPMELHHRFRDLFGWEALEGCGMTEVGCYYTVNPRYGRRKWGSLGLPTPHTELRVIDDDGRDVAMGAVGEIVVRTPSATIGYWRDPVATADLFRDGWLHTGDLGHVDEDGYLWFVGRRKLMIVRRGSNIAPAEVENVLDEHPQVHASVVVGVPDAHDGSVPVAWIMPVHDARAPDEGALRAYVSTRLAPYQSPVYYLFTRDLPRNSTGKFDRCRLQELAIEACLSDLIVSVSSASDRRASSER
jgi:acyl-CoA synthetase (AMP-forming)/AMP-acid ligase II